MEKKYQVLEIWNVSKNEIVSSEEVKCFVISI